MVLWNRKGRTQGAFLQENKASPHRLTHGVQMYIGDYFSAADPFLKNKNFTRSSVYTISIMASVADMRDRFLELPPGEVPPSPPSR